MGVTLINKPGFKKLDGCAIFEDGTVITDEAVYRYVKKHSTLLDRLNSRKMVEMTFWAFDILCGSIEPPCKAKDWTFYDKNPKTLTRFEQ